MGIHVLGAPYFQCRVWQKITEEAKDCGPQGGSPGDINIPKEVVHDSFKHVFLHDFGILAYAAILVASFVWSWFGATWIASGHAAPVGATNLTVVSDGAANPCDQDGYAGYAAYFGQCMFYVAIIYTGCYYCCGCCASSVTIRAPPIAYGH